MNLRFNRAGLINIGYHNWELHFLVKPEHWIWGHQIEEYDQSLIYYGFGPLFLFVRM